MLIKPLPLKIGDKVALTAPASPVSSPILQKAVESIEFLGLNPILMPSCTLSHGYLAGPDSQRAKDLNRAFADPEIRGIFCLRGGFGAARLLPLLDLEMIRQHPKVFVGYSDITALHTVFNKLCGFITYHAPMPNTGYMQLDSYSLSSLKKNLFSASSAGSVSNPPGEKLEVLCPGKAEGIITGGNLSLLQSTLGSQYEIDTTGKLLFIEEVGELPYRVDKALTALALAGKFRDCAGILLGTFAQCEEPPADTASKRNIISESSLTLYMVFHEVIKPWGKPTLLNFRCGHVYPQSTIPMGAFASFDTQFSQICFD